MNKLLFFVACLITYGSLYPFGFNIAVVDSARLQLFIGNWGGLTNTSDTLSNIALFIPFGIVGMLAFTTLYSSRRFFLVMALSFVLGLILQALQLLIPQRIPAIYDVIWNLAGTAVGAFSSMFVARYIPDKLKQQWLSVPVLLIGCWLAYRLMPFIPSIDWQLLKTSLKPLLLQPVFSIVDSIREMTGWLVVAFIWPKSFMPRLGKYHIGILILPVFILEIIIVDNVLTLSDVTGALLAVVIWWGVLARSRNKDVVIVLLLLMTLVLQGFSPFTLKDNYASFSWIPFSGFLTGSMLVNSKVLFGKLFLYGSLIWIISKNNIVSIVPATVFMAFWLSLIEIGQIFVSNHTSEITDPVVAIIIGIGMYSYLKHSHPVREKVIQQKIDDHLGTQKGSEHTSINKLSEYGYKIHPYPSVRVTVILSLIGIIIPTIAMYVFVKMPGIPYNVQELFRGDLLSMAIFSLAILWIGISGAIVGNRISFSPRPYIALPTLVFSAGLLSYILISVSVTSESIADIVGSSNIVWQVEEIKGYGETLVLPCSQYLTGPKV